MDLLILSIYGLSYWLASIPNITFHTEKRRAAEFADRVASIAFLGIAGIVSGLFIGKGSHDLTLPRPKEFIKGASALTTVAYATIVTIKFIFEGLDPARTLSSRLSTTTTILVAALAIPGWLGYRLGYVQFLNRPKQPPEN